MSAKMFPFTYCHYDGQWHRMRANAKRCPSCGAVVNFRAKSTSADHPVQYDFLPHGRPSDWPHK